MKIIIKVKKNVAEEYKGVHKELICDDFVENPRPWIERIRVERGGKPRKKRK